MLRALYSFLTLSACFFVTVVHGHHDGGDPLQQLLQSNVQWAANITAMNSSFFEDSAKGQYPAVLWFGCSDSRVPESVITQSLPGDIFVQRNIANQIPEGDNNAVSVLEYGVEHLQVSHVIVVGHSNCGGATASLNAALAGQDCSQTIPDLPASDPLNKWLTPLTEYAYALLPWVSSLPKDEALETFIEENVKKQVEGIVNSHTIQETWKKAEEGTGHPVWVHGWVYDLSTGLLTDLKVSRGPD